MVLIPCAGIHSPHLKVFYFIIFINTVIYAVQLFVGKHFFQMFQRNSLPKHFPVVLIDGVLYVKLHAFLQGYFFAKSRASRFFAIALQGKNGASTELDEANQTVINAQCLKQSYLAVFISLFLQLLCRAV